MSAEVRHASVVMKVVWSDDADIPLSSPFQARHVQLVSALIISPLDGVHLTSGVDASLLKRLLVPTRLKSTPSKTYSLEVTTFVTIQLQVRVLTSQDQHLATITEYAITRSTQIILLDEELPWRLPDDAELTSAGVTSSFIDDLSRTALLRALQAKRPQWILLEGDTGSGKTSLSLSTAHSLGMTVLVMTHGNYRGRGIHGICQASLALQPSVLLFGRDSHLIVS